MLNNFLFQHRKCEDLLPFVMNKEYLGFALLVEQKSLKMSLLAQGNYHAHFS